MFNLLALSLFRSWAFLEQNKTKIQSGCFLFENFVHNIVMWRPLEQDWIGCCQTVDTITIGLITREREEFHSLYTH